MWMMTCKSDGATLFRVTDKPPNKFIRVLQRVFLRVEWKKI